MAKADIWMPLFIGDYLADTSRLTTEQHGAYLLLIMDYWRNGPPPDNVQVLSQITRLSPDSWSMTQAMLKQFFRIEDGCWRHKRIDEELILAKTNKEAAQKKAKVAADARWGKERKHTSSDAPSINQAMLEECPSPSPSPSTVPAALPAELQKAKNNVNTTVEQKQLDLQIETIFGYWQKVMDSPKSALDKKRISLIKTALKNYSPADICKAIRGCSKTPHNMGKNDRNTKFNGLDLILRSAEKIDYFIRLDDVAATSAVETITQRNERIMAEVCGTVADLNDLNTIDMEAA